jgi:hypothetical protein
MEDFYGHLLAGEDRAEPLRQAQSVLLGCCQLPGTPVVAPGFLNRKKFSYTVGAMRQRPQDRSRKRGILSPSSRRRMRSEDMSGIG